MEGDLHVRAAEVAEQRYGRQPLFPRTLLAALGAWVAVFLFSLAADLPHLETTQTTYAVVAIAGLIGFLSGRSRDRARRKFARELAEEYTRASYGLPRRERFPAGGARPVDKETLQLR